MKSSCDCIIPFYNEGKRVTSVIESVIKIPNLSKIIVVDDGSKDKLTYLEIKTNFPQIKVVRLNQNGGKSDAIKQGLKHVTATHILLLDGDLQNIVADEFGRAVDKMLNNPDIDLIILRRSKDKTGTAWLRWDIVTSGQRVIKKYDLIEILKSKLKCYQLEMATNFYMISKNKRVYWMHSSIQNLHKHRKWGFIEGMKIGIPGLISYTGWKDTIWQSLFFCRNEIS